MLQGLVSTLVITAEFVKTISSDFPKGSQFFGVLLHK